MDDHNARIVRVFGWALLGLALLCPLSLLLARQLPPTSPFYVLLALLAALGPAVFVLIGVALLPVAAHELGHMTAARLVGIRTYGLALGPCVSFRHKEWCPAARKLRGGCRPRAPACGHGEACGRDG
jgi:hypothetical protein